MEDESRLPPVDRRKPERLVRTAHLISFDPQWNSSPGCTKPPTNLSALAPLNSSPSVPPSRVCLPKHRVNKAAVDSCGVEKIVGKSGSHSFPLRPRKLVGKSGSLLFCEETGSARCRFFISYRLQLRATVLDLSCAPTLALTIYWSLPARSA